ncbi:hypothetical protein BU14_0501s0006 [Porphyra umbilicalis]|uniref:Uncharacterized protein n=1 Tax=Porphyra umbilicalis TaxID=2786 RepID=A0A1X6NT92_PORUM|nr:hypothetical protein BU14_0501s0006 [Porphyra umbilicalis]|eukprot:OSX71785.1 hypothetical protein BU14_0501s0006 [Porphyra umbilicalis]
MAIPAFAPAAAAGPARRLRLAPPTVGAFPPEPPAAVAVRRRRVTAAAPVMQAGGGGGDAFNFPGLGGGGGAGGGFFDSPIVREEGQALVRDQEALRRLGHSYGNFDAAGKRLYIDEMEALYERWLVMTKRLELSSDFQAQLQRKQLLEQMEQAGMSFDQFDRSTRHAFAMMRKEVKD